MVVRGGVDFSTIAYFADQELPHAKQSSIEHC